MQQNGKMSMYSKRDDFKVCGGEGGADFNKASDN